jgi:hypothetical protein
MFLLWRFICQENKTDALEHKKQRGIQTLKERASQRQKIL